MAEPWTVPRFWRGQTVAIVAGGPSLSLADVHRLAQAKGRRAVRVIAVNDAVYPCWWADWLHAGDGKWWEHHAGALGAWPGIRTTTTASLLDSYGVRLLQVSGTDGFDPDPAYVRSGHSSAYHAICAAVHAGAARVLLLGLDMKTAADGRRHWFGEHWDGTEVDYAATMLPCFETLVEPLAALDVEIFNCAPDSALTCFRPLRLADLL